MTAGDETAARTLRVLQVICGALAGAVVLYVAVGVSLAGRAAAPGTTLLPWLLVAAGLVSLGVGEILRGLLLRSADPARRVQGFFVANLVAVALREGAALLGLVAMLTGGGLPALLGLAALALAAMALGWPTRDRMESFLATPP